MAVETKTVNPKEPAPTRFWNWLTETQVWKSVFRHNRPDNDRNRVLVMLSNVFLHLHPVRIRKSGVKLRYTWCMGGLSFFLFLVLTFTGLLLMLSVTGYLLPWDQLAIWAITVGSNMARATPFLGHEGPDASLLRLGDVPLIHAQDDARFALLGGTFVGEGALLRFYVLHCVGLPLAIAVLMAVHFWRVRKDGGISGPL